MDTSQRNDTKVEHVVVNVIRKQGEAPIKAEYIKQIPLSILNESNTESNDQQIQTKKSKERGTFKKRPIDAIEDPSESLCRPIAAGEGCRYGNECKFSHNTIEYMKRKVKDLPGDICPVFQAYGYCRYGLLCRYSKLHTRIMNEAGDVENDKIASTADNVQNYPSECNELNNELRTLLRKDTYPFRSKQQVKKNKQKNKQIQSESKEVPLEEYQINESLVLPERKPIDFKEKIYLAPLTTVGNLPYRRLMTKLGVDITCGEMALASNLLRAQQSEWALLRRHETEKVFGVQIAGGYGDQMARVCELLTRETNIDFIDINMGCPIDIVCNAGAGAALMNHPPKLCKVISGALTGIELGALDILPTYKKSERYTINPDQLYPGLTVKLRTGWSEKHPVAHKLMSKIQNTYASNEFRQPTICQEYKLQAKQSLDAITIHGRSRLQRYSRQADWDYIYQCQDALDKDETSPNIPVIGGGDVLSFEEFDTHLKSGVLSTCMIARGALIKPWLPIELKERRHFDISANERFDLLKDFVKFGLEHWGSDQKGVNRTRRYLLEWQSFLYRYIPVGLLEVLPQKINERPQAYYGRNDLETLFASDQAVDWIKISEMLLGPVPDGFKFIPKHKANAYTS